MVKDLDINDKEKEKTLSEKVNESYDFFNKVKSGSIKKKDLKIPRKAKVRRGKLKKGWIGVIKIDENGNLSGEKQKVSDSTFKVRSGEYHSTDGREILFWQGKYPVVIQPSWKENPLNIREEAGNKNETYGQKYVQARIMKDAIKMKSGGNFSPLIWIVVLGVVGYVLYSLFTGGF